MWGKKSNLFFSCKNKGFKFFRKLSPQKEALQVFRSKNHKFFAEYSQKLFPLGDRIWRHGTQCPVSNKQCKLSSDFPGIKFCYSLRALLNFTVQENSIYNE